MKYRPINNFDYSNISKIEIPSTIEVEMKKTGMQPYCNHIASTDHHGVHIKVRKPMQERDLSTEELLNLFDKKESLTLAYIPHFITQCIIYYLDLLVAYARDNRLSEYKKHSRMLRNLRAEYYEALRHEMPYTIFQKFLSQRERYLSLCGANLQLMYFTFGNELSKIYGRQPHETLFCYANIMTAFVEYIEDFDKKANAKIAQKMGMPCKNHGDARLSEIKYICKNITKDYPIEDNAQTELCVNVMVNKAKVMINEMLD